MVMDRTKTCRFFSNCWGFL